MCYFVRVTRSRYNLPQGCTCPPLITPSWSCCLLSLRASFICMTGTTETYVGLTATDFKTRWRNHQMSFKHEKRRNDTELSKYLWKLKEKKEGYSISWKIIAKAKAYSNTTKRCNLCITEKFLSPRAYFSEFYGISTHLL